MPLSRKPIARRPPEVLSNGSLYHSIVQQHITTNSGPPAAGAWPSANLAIAQPFYVDVPKMAQRLWVWNGTVSGNIDIGIYDEDFNLVISSGSIAHATANNFMNVDITDVTLGRGTFYVAMSLDNTTATINRSIAGIAAFQSSFGICQMASAHPLPSLFVPATVGQSYVPIVGVAYKTVL